MFLLKSRAHYRGSLQGSTRVLGYSFFRTWVSFFEIFTKDLCVRGVYSGLWMCNTTIALGNPEKRWAGTTQTFQNPLIKEYILNHIRDPIII